LAEPAGKIGTGKKCPVEKVYRHPGSWAVFAGEPKKKNLLPKPNAPP